MVVSRINIKNPTRLTAQLTAGLTAMTNEIVSETQVDIRNIAEKNVDRFIGQNSEFRYLFTPEGRGIFGFAVDRFKFASDTGPEDLVPFIKERIRVTRTRRRGNLRGVRLQFPAITFIAQNMKHNLSAVNRRAFDQSRRANPQSAGQSFRPRRPGPKVSWFSWWEFGDKNFIANRTVLLEEAEEILEELTEAGATARESRQASRLRTIINLGSRSRQGIQLSGPPSSIRGAGVVTSAYGKIGRALARSADRVLAKATRKANRGGKLNAVFRRAVTFGGGF